jgi:hypothetical protein
MSFSLRTILHPPEIIFMGNCSSKLKFMWHISIVFNIPVIEKLNNSVKYRRESAMTFYNLPLLLFRTGMPFLYPHLL